MPDVHKQASRFHAGYKVQPLYSAQDGSDQARTCILHLVSQRVCRAAHAFHRSKSEICTPLIRTVGISCIHWRQAIFLSQSSFLVLRISLITCSLVKPSRGCFLLDASSHSASKCFFAFLISGFMVLK